MKVKNQKTSSGLLWEVANLTTKMPSLWSSLASSGALMRRVISQWSRNAPIFVKMIWPMTTSWYWTMENKYSCGWAQSVVKWRSSWPISPHKFISSTWGSNNLKDLGNCSWLSRIKSRRGLRSASMVGVVTNFLQNKWQFYIWIFYKRKSILIRKSSLDCILKLITYFKYKLIY